MRCLLLSCVVLAGACGGRAAEPAAPQASSSQVVRAFMKAAADSNLTRMGELWGLAGGPANQTRPIGYEKRLVVMQVYLRGDSIQILSDRPQPDDDRRRLVVMALFRGTCVKQISDTIVRSRAGAWLVLSVDLNAAGNPARPCEQ